MFFYLFLIIVIFVLLIIFSKIEIEFNNMKIENKKIKKDYNIILKLKILGNFNILKLNITQRKLDKINIKKIIKKMEKFNGELLTNKNNIDKKMVKGIRHLKIDVNYLDLKIELGTENAALTSFLVAGISSIIGILISNKIKQSKQQKFIVMPIYNNKNLLKLEVDCIFTIKMIHIIYVIYIIKKKDRRSDKNGRASDRRPYGYGYE